ncbi:MAG: DUF3105 domain-containing protein [Pseudonocardia sp.]|nr:DUF3105 domain-containing protein [Pseudonocardia sp.]
MVSGKNSKSARNARNAVVVQRSTPWGLIAGILVVVLFAGAIFGYAFYQSNEKSAATAALAPFTPTETNKDPSAQIQGVQTIPYSAGDHITPDVRVAYTHSPPLGGKHDGFWAACNGVVYPTAVRQENLVHSIEHGAVWIAYNPDQVSGAALDTLKAKVSNQPYMVMAPYPGLDQPISLQSWAHQLKLSDANDPRIDQFIAALKLNRFTYPEVGASCDSLGAGRFDEDNPPAFVPTPPASAVNGTTIVDETSQSTGVQPDATGTPGS